MNPIFDEFGQPRYTCGNCGRYFATDYRLTSHEVICRAQPYQTNHGPLTDTTCDLCRRVFNTRAGMMSHRSECLRHAHVHELTRLLGDPDVPVYECDCGERFVGFDAARQHQRDVAAVTSEVEVDVEACRDDLVALLEELR